MLFKFVIFFNRSQMHEPQPVKIGPAPQPRIAIKIIKCLCKIEMQNIDIGWHKWSEASLFNLVQHRAEITMRFRFHPPAKRIKIRLQKQNLDVDDSHLNVEGHSSDINLTISGVLKIQLLTSPSWWRGRQSSSWLPSYRRSWDPCFYRQPSFWKFKNDTAPSLTMTQ